MKAEFIALELAGQETKWRKGPLADMPLWRRQPTAIFLQCDSHATIGVAHNSVYNEKKRHLYPTYCGETPVKTRRYFLEIRKIRESLADPQTKGLTRQIAFISRGG